jgi:hypothetical protein
MCPWSFLRASLRRTTAASRQSQFPRECERSTWSARSWAVPAARRPGRSSGRGWIIRHQPRRPKGVGRLGLEKTYPSVFRTAVARPCVLSLTLLNPRFRSLGATGVRGSRQCVSHEFDQFVTYFGFFFARFATAAVTPTRSGTPVTMSEHGQEHSPSQIDLTTFRLHRQRVHGDEVAVIVECRRLDGRRSHFRPRRTTSSPESFIAATANRRRTLEKAGVPAHRAARDSGHDPARRGVRSAAAT